MVMPAQTHQDQLDRIKKNVEKWYDYFKDNNDNWHKWKKFLYVTSISDDERTFLKDVNKPIVEFNILEAYVSRQKGEFSKQEPSFNVSKGPTGDVDPKSIDVVNGHMRLVECNMRKDNEAYDIYDDMMSGAFSVASVYTDYSNEMSFEQDIKVKRVFDPTLCGFDPLSREAHKGDGEYCFELVVMRAEEFKTEYPNLDTSTLSYTTRTGDEGSGGAEAKLEQFQWSYKTNQEKLIMVANYFEKKKVRTKLFKLSDGNVMTEKQYEEFLVKWEFDNKIEQAPQPVGKPRWTNLTHITRYRFIENQVIKVDQTDYKYLPLVFFDFDSVKCRESLSGPMKQYCRPYCYQARGVLQLKNSAGQTLLSEIENMVQHKFRIPIEGIPEEYKSVYTNPQTASVMVYNQFLDNNPDVRLDPPQVIPRVPTPPEVTAAFNGADQTTQAILGMYDAALGINKNELSGKAIIEAATQSNATAMPGIVGYMSSLTRIATIILDLIPKYYATPRSIPIIDKDGEHQYMQINGPGQPKLSYSPIDLNVSVKAGVNFAIQKNRSFQTVVALMQASPTFEQFVNNTPAGLNMLLDNIEMYGVDKLKEGVDAFLQQVQQQKAQEAQENASQPNPMVQIQQQKLALEAMQDTRDAKIKVAQVAVSDKNADTNRILAMSKVDRAESDQAIAADKIQAEKERDVVNTAIAAAEMAHKHKKDVIEVTQKGKQE